MAAAQEIDRTAPPEAEATRALYERYAAQIFRYCLHQLGSREEAEDAVQSTFLNAFRGLKRGVEPELESAWLFKIAHNVCLSRRRSSWRRGRVEAPADFDAVEEIAHAPVRRADELIGLQDALEGMPEQQRRAILLREWQGLSYREIAAELELSQSAVETLIFRARRSLASGLERPAEVALRRRRAPVGAVANVVSSAQSWLLGGGAAAAKVAATVAVVGTGTVVVAAPMQHLSRPTPAHPRVAPKPQHRQAPRHAAAAAGAAPAAAAVEPRAAAPVRHRAARPQHARRKAAAAPPVRPVVPAPAPVAAPPPPQVVPAPAPVETVPAVVGPERHGRGHGRVELQPAPAVPQPTPSVQQERVRPDRVRDRSGR
ncbi:MAG TPA: RNA polymerase sigma factor, partial [Gaiellaceae bacterium]|nr:RNA polymerase sigma factor [Gaiellaceae bacterium]